MDNDRKEWFSWMAEWCARQGLALELEGECGIGRECVGVLAGGSYPDYQWFDSEYARIDPNGEVWTPEDAYHKHPCVAVLGRGEHAEEQLYRWLRWFDSEGFAVEQGALPRPKNPSEAMQQMMTGGRYARMVRDG